MYQTKKSNISLISYPKGNMNYAFLETGDIYEFCKEFKMVNQLQGNLSDGALSNIYLRVHKECGRIEVFPLRGKNSTSVLQKSEERLLFKGEVKGINYKVEFIPAGDSLWFWNVVLEGNHTECDLVYIQDTGVADKGALLNNILYVSQYLDHKIMENEYGYVIGSRQNMSQGGKNPFLQQGCFGKKVIGYATDAMQIYGRKSKLTHIPEALYEENLPNEKYQYELACVALQTEKIVLNGTENVAFYGYFKEDYPKKVEIIEAEQEILEAWNQVKEATVEYTENVPVIPYSNEFGAKYSSETFTKEEIEQFFPDRKLEEFDGEQLLSFFTNNHRHVVLQEKEVKMERPHGHIVMSVIPDDHLDKELLTATNYMYGVFCSQAVIGNVDSNPLLTNTKGLLNLHQEYGLRIFVKMDGVYRLLTMPAVYEIGLNSAKWYYKIEDDILVVTTFMTANNNAIVINAKSTNGKTYECLGTMSLALSNGGTNEQVQIKELENGVALKPDVNKASMNYYSNLEYYVTFTKGTAKISDDSIFYADRQTRNALLLTSEVTGEDFELVIRGVLEEKALSDDKGYTYEAEEAKYLAFYDEFLRGTKLSCENHEREVDRFNEICYWYLHNAMIHYAVPHGLEQSGGAAWGTRDVCQGPMELFLTTGHFELAKNTLFEIFAHQNSEHGEWPQWFMFDKYPYAADDCHGDVVFWPLKCVGDYIEATQDTDVLLEEIPYVNGGSASLLEHIKVAFKNIQSRYLFDTYLVNYAGGDWDDTLQPANKELKERLCSAWTQGLAYQALSKLKNCVYAVDTEFFEELSKNCEGMKHDFTNYLIKDGVIAGFIFMKSKEEISYMLHPLDTQTGLNYRLLPLTRSIIAELVTPEQAQVNNQVIDAKLVFPDGVRLMDKPAGFVTVKENLENIIKII